MIDWFSITVYALCGAILVMMSAGILLSAFMPALSRWNRRYFIMLFTILLLYAVVLTIDMVIYNLPGLMTEKRILIIIEFLLFSMLVPMPMPFLLHSCGEFKRDSIPLRAVIMLWILFCMMLFTGQFTDAFYYTTPDNELIRSPWFPLLITPLTTIVIFNIVCLIRRRKKLSKKYFTALLIYLLPTAIFIIVYMFAAVDILVSFWMALCALTMLGIIFSDSIQQHVRQQREIANQRVNVLVLQMRPHFIYNTMTTIYYLCKQDADKAQQVTLDFTTYLRNNFSAIASEDTVPFKDELEHTRAYLAVEQAQHEDMLFVEYDTPHINFRVPPLTLQPLVENAVKHCLNPNGDPLRIYVKTRRKDACSEIIVEDNGEGFEPSDDNNDPHIALNNIRQRLEMMCKGKLGIEPREGGGTLVRVTIPASDTSVTE